MASFYVWVTFGLCLLKLCLTETQFNVSCRYGGVFHVEKNGRYSLTRTEAADLCRALNSTLSTLEQLEKAHELGFETCRYGFIVGHIVIPRINPYHLCAANHTGIYKLSANTTGRYDAYCYNATETRDKACDPIERIDTSFLNNQSEIVIDNEDGSRYNADGTRHSGDSSTSGVDDENVGSGSSHDTTPVDTSIRRSSPSYYGSVTPVSHLSDHSSGGGEKDFPVKNSDDEISPTSTDISLVTGFNDFAKEDDEWHRGSTNVTSSGNGSDDEDSSEETTYPTVFPGWDISVAKKEYAPSTTPGPHRVHLEKTTTQTWWNPFSNEWWWSNAREKTQEPTQTTRADVTSSGNGSDDEDSSEETTYPTVFPGWDISVAKKEYAPSTTDVTSSGNGSDDEDSSEETTYPTVFPGWDISVAKKEYAPSTTMDLQHGVLLEISTQDHWNPSYTDEEEQYPSSAGRALVTNENEKRQGPTQHPLLHSAHSGWISQAQNPANTTGSTEHQEFTLPGENDIEKKTSYTAMASSHGARQNDSAQDPLVYPGWDKGEDYSTQAPVMDRIIPSRESNHEKESSNTALATPDGAHHEDSTQPPLSSDNEAGWGTEGITHPTDAPGGEVLHGLNPASTNEAGDDSLLTGTITESVDVVSREEATKEPLAPSTQPGSESEQANTTDGSYVNLVPGVFSDIDDHHNQLQTPLPPTLATPDGAHHEDSTQPPLSSDNEAGWGTEGITHPTDAPGGEVLHGLNPASTNEAGDDSLLTGTITASIDVLEPEDVTQEVWAPRVIVTALATPDGAHHEDSTQPPLSSDNEAGWGTEGITHPTDAPGGEVLHGLNPASTNEAGDDSLLTGTITESVDVVSREEATKEPLAPSTQPGSESEQANTTDGSYVNLVPGVFSDIDDHHNQLQTPLPPRSTSIIDDDHGSRKGNVEPTSNPGENATTTITSQPRSAQVPEWLIIVAALLALALILAVCIAVSSRRRCGQKKKLVINNGKGAVEDRKTSELNGDASKSQEMVHLVHKEQSNDRTGASDEFLTIDETQNHQELDMKSGV
ncbi:CD44 antigen isoform X11 [Anser cygnoides]|uniref:CD44 antigen isoform X11 n=1 Tax=Anser cygnoides TaxID=8845 RepID=UPI0034D37710